MRFWCYRCPSPAAFLFLTTSAFIHFPQSQRLISAITLEELPSTDTGQCEGIQMTTNTVRQGGISLALNKTYRKQAISSRCPKGTKRKKKEKKEAI